MFVHLESKAEIAEAQRALEGTIAENFTETATRTIGYPGGRVPDAKVMTDGRYWFWSSKGKGKAHPRRLNWFGLYQVRKNLEITVEVNVPFDGVDKVIEGFFGRDLSTGTVYLMHSGGVGGGKEGVGKNAFLATANQEIHDVRYSSGLTRRGIIVMPVKGPAATKPAIRYVEEIAAFKQAKRDGTLDTAEVREKERILKEAFSEPRGRRQGTRSSTIDYVSRHGEVVDAVKEWRSLRPLPVGGRFVKNVLIDLGIEACGSLWEVFEVKTSASRQDLYTAIGQLIVHGNGHDCQRTIVLPHDEIIADDVCRALDRLKIGLLKFKIDKRSTAIVSR